MNIKIFLPILLLALALSSCGRKGGLSYPGEQKKPDFNNVFDEE